MDTDPHGTRNDHSLRLHHAQEVQHILARERFEILRTRRGAKKSVEVTDEVKSALGRLLALVSKREEDPFARANEAGLSA